jgi:prepilin-type N-terminal cleavage/methylation domain-containing protein
MKNKLMTRKSAFTLVEIMIVVAIIALLAAIAIPNFVKARQASQKSACIANLKQIDGAKATWALENKKTSADTPTTAMLYGATNYIRSEPFCPGGGTYTINAVDTKPQCTLETSDGHLEP